MYRNVKLNAERALLTAVQTSIKLDKNSAESSYYPMYNHTRYKELSSIKRVRTLHSTKRRRTLMTAVQTLVKLDKKVKTVHYVAVPINNTKV